MITRIVPEAFVATGQANLNQANARKSAQASQNILDAYEYLQAAGEPLLLYQIASVAETSTNTARKHLYAMADEGLITWPATDTHLPPITPNRLITHVKPSNHADPRPEPQPRPSVVWGREAPMTWRPWLNEADRSAYPAKDAAAYTYLEYQAMRRGSWKGTETEDEGQDE